MIKKMFSVLPFMVLLMNLQAQVSQDPRTLFTVAGDKVTVGEFEYVYTKNNANNQSDYSEKSLRDYLKLYENFRLKVKEAEALKLDTIKSLKDELETYRKQLAKNYLTDREISDKLIQEAYDRSKVDVNASHILIFCDENANPADTALAFKRIMALRKKIEKGTPFEKVAKDSSEDKSARTNEGNIGWFTVFGTIYPFENAVYTLKPGEISQPVRTQFGYHLVRVNETRPSRGSMQVAHILFRFADKATQAEKDSIRKNAESVYAKMKSGALSFDSAVVKFSDDKATRIKGGELQQWVGASLQQKYPKAFEDAAYSLAKDGDYSAPVMTDFGYHIVKRVQVKSTPTFAEAKADFKKKVERDTRSQVAKDVLVNRIKRENSFTESLQPRTDFFNKVDSAIFKGNWKADSTLRNTQTLFVLAGKNYSVSDFADYVEKTAKKRNDKSKNALLNEYYDGFVTAKCLEYEESTLESKKPEFKSLMKEYRDGILLFELMDRQVWTKAVKDTTGLEEFRKKNEKKYMWDERVEAVVFNGTDQKITDAARKLASKGKSLDDIKKLNKPGSKSVVSLIEKKYIKGEYDIIDKTGWKVGVTDVNKINDSSYQFIWVKRLVAPEPKSLKEAKGYIVSDYQEFLEKSWLDELRRKYPIVVDEAVLKSLIKK